MEKLNEFFDLLMGGDYFILFIIVLMLIIFALIIYLIKLQVADKKPAEFDEFEEFLESKNKKKNDDKTMQVSNEPIHVEENEHPSQVIETIKQEINPIEIYEENQEEEAIISASELKSKLNDISSNGLETEYDINKYEEEQEKKAIISYEELLNRASNVTLQYKEENVEGLKVSKVNINDPLSPGEPYKYEEEFLRALKEFRASL